MQFLRGYFTHLRHPEMSATAIKVALVVGSTLFAINHGMAAARGNMSRDRWVSAGLTYVVPYMVSIHGQYSNKAKRALVRECRG